MIQQLDELAGLLADTPIAGRAVAELPILDTNETALLIEISPGEILEAWRAARALLDRTGRWPVAATCWDFDASGSWAERFAAEDLFSRFYFEQGAGGLDVSPAALQRRAATVDLESVLARAAAEEDEIEPLADVLEDALAQTEDAFGAAPSAEEVAAAALDGKPLATAADLDRWLASWERSRFGDEVMNRELGPESWYEPNQPCALVLLPTRDGWNALTYLGWYAGAGRDDAELAALARSWHERFGAELVAHWGTMLQLVVERPPTDEATAWQLAREHTLVAPCTILLPGTPLRDYARGLIGADRWFLHERP